MSNKVPFNEQQQEAIVLAVDWYTGFRRRAHYKQVFFLAGQAGTGKTSTADEIAIRCVGGEHNRHRIAYIAPTGKAASRMRQKGCKGARTVHQFTYNILGEDDEGQPIFREKVALDEKPLLIVCDEVSMIGERDDRALRSHGIPILALGDLGQVPPVKAKAAYTEENADYELTKIERTSEDSNIVRAARFVRAGKRLPVREYDDVKVREGSPSLEAILAHCGEEDQMLCVFNNTRAFTNDRVRRSMGYEPFTMPNIGEKIICTSNQHDFGFMNGEQMIVESYRKPTDDERAADWPDDMLIIVGKNLSTGRSGKMACINPASFSPDAEVRMLAQKSAGGFDYGYCITIHKSQGSEWDNVLVIEETIRGEYAKMMYTAFTRAVKTLSVYRAV